MIRRKLRNTRDLILIIVDWLYIPFQKYIPELTFRYAVCGGFNTAMDIVLYFLCYNFILDKQIVDLGIISIGPHIAAFMIVFPITFTSGFLLMKYVTFTESELKGKTQLLRYMMTVGICILLNYILIKFFVEYCGLYATVSKILTTIIVVLYSYFSQKHFTFKLPSDKEIPATD